MALRMACAAPNARPDIPLAAATAPGTARLWFTTSRGLAVFDPHARQPVDRPPALHLQEVSADGQETDLSRPARLSPDTERIRIRYTAVHLSAPEEVEYSYRLEGLENTWVRADGRREINYNSLKHGYYRFTAKAQLPDGQSAQQSYAFEVLSSLL